MTPTLYQTLLGAAFFRLPDTLRALHGVHGAARYSGQVTVVREVKRENRRRKAAGEAPLAAGQPVDKRTLRRIRAVERETRDGQA